MSGNLLSISGTAVDFGSISAGQLEITGAAVLAVGAVIGGPISVGTAGWIDFGGTLIAGENARGDDQPAVSMAVGAMLLGDGMLIAGNSADPGMILGPGTLLAGCGDTLTVDDASISGGAQLEVAGGGVLILGPRLSTDSLVTIGFKSDYGIAPISGGVADRLALDGGVIVIDDPLAFGGTIIGLAAGDRLVLPGLTGLAISNVTSQSFAVTGTNSANQTEEFTLHAGIASGTALFTGTDAAGDAEIGLSPMAPALFAGGSMFGTGQIDAGVVGQPLLGLQLIAPGWTTQSLVLTLSVDTGLLSNFIGVPSAILVLAAASPAALNAMLSGIFYTAGLSTGGDTLTASSNTGLLAGFTASEKIVIEAGGDVAGFTHPPTAEQTAVFAGPATVATLVTQSAAPGEVIVAGLDDFDDVLEATGIGGIALTVEGGGVAIFDAGSQISLAAGVQVGDTSGAGTLGIVTDDFAIGAPAANADLWVGGAGMAPGSAVDVTGGLNVAGNVVLGQVAASRLDVSGTMQVLATTIGAAGTLTASGSANVAFGMLLDAGTATLNDATRADAQQLVLTGKLALEGGAILSGLNSAVIAAGGSLTVGPDAAFSAAGFDALGGSVLDQGVLLVAGNLLAHAPITLEGGLLVASAPVFGAGGTLAGYGNVAANNAGSSIALAGGEILASGGTLVVDGNVVMTGGGNIDIAGAAGLDLFQAVSGGTISFAGAGAGLTLHDLSSDSATVAGMVAGDVIDLVGVEPDQVSFAGGRINAGSHGGFALQTAADQPPVQVISDNAAGSLVTLGGQIACFARGTRLLTPNGYVPVENFKPGDPIITRLGIRRGVRWIGRRDVEINLHSRQDLRPVLVLPGAIGPGLPSRAVRLSPSHALFIDGALIPVMHLVNGATILRESRGNVTYYHVELDRHDLLISEGLPVESYIDTGNRGEFQQEQGRRCSFTKPCAPVLTSGPKLARIRRSLHERILQTGFALGHDLKLQGIVAGMRLEPEMRLAGGLRVARFALPPDADRLLLLAPTAAPAETDPDSDDRRELALCLRQPRAKSRRLTLGAGWYPRAQGDAGIWMSNAGEILLPPRAGELTLDLLAVAQSWRRLAVDFVGAEP